MARISTLYFIHGGRVVRGSLKRRINQHRMEINAHCYVMPDGSEGPYVLNFFRRLGHEEITADAGVLLALVQEIEQESEANENQ